MPSKNYPIFYSVRVDQQTWANVYVNDIPLFRPQVIEPDSRSGLLNYLLKPGENEVSMEVMKAREQGGKMVEGCASFSAYINKTIDDPTVEGVDPDYLAQVFFPKVYHQAEERFRHLPFFYRTTFDVGLPIATPAFFDAPEVDFPTSGTPELRAATKRIFESLENEKYSDFLDALELRFLSDEAALPGAPQHSAAFKRGQFMQEVCHYKPRLLRPFDDKRIIYESRRNGQVAVVRTIDDGPALQALCEDKPERFIMTDLYMVQNKGQWKVFA